MKQLKTTIILLAILLSNCAKATDANPVTATPDNGDGNTPQVVLNLFPEVPSAATNTYWQYMATTAVRIGVPIPASPTFREADEILPAAYTYLHPQSPRKGDLAVRGRLLDLLNAEFHYYGDGAGRYGDMLHISQMAQAYYMLKIYSPQDLSSYTTPFWDEVLTKQSEFVLNQKPALYNDLKLTACWLNGDIRLAMGLYFSGLILNKPDWSKKAENFMEQVVPRTILNGGGSRYVSYQNESPTYHSDSKQFSYRWWYLTGSRKMKDFLSKMTPYVPMTVHGIGKGYVEFSSSPSWKIYYNPNIPDYAAAISALMFYDKYSWTVGQVSKMWDLAFIYRDNVEKKALPDNYVVLDENNIGPRGRFGRWGYVGYGRNLQSPLPESNDADAPDMDGKLAIAGAYILNESASATQYPLNAAFQAAMPAAKMARGVETDFSRGKVTNDLVAAEKSSKILSKEVSSMATRYTLSKSRFVTIPWDGIHQWIFTPRRIVGMMAIESNKDNNVVYGLMNRVKLVSGRNKVAGTRKELIEIGSDKNHYSYGDLEVYYHQQNYNGRTSFYYYGTMNDPADTYSCMLQLHDQADKVDDNQLTYAKGFRKYVIVEVVPKGSTPSSSVAMINTGTSDLCGFSMTEEQNSVTIMHNVSGQTKNYTATIAADKGNLYLAKSWEDGTVSQLSIASGKGTVNVDIPANQHIIVVSSSMYDPRYNRYGDIFN